MTVSRTITAFLALALLTGVASAQLELQLKAGEPLRGLTPAQLAAFSLGKAQFNRTFTEAEGLGPIFNQNSCASCHNNPVGGSGTILVTRFGLLDPESGAFDPLTSLGGSLRQDQAISIACQETIPPIANTVANRVTNSTLGAGLVEAILDSDIVGNANNPPAGVNGEVHMVPMLEDPAAGLRPGRFGWKAQVATVLTFSGDAALNEMGITNRLVGQENAPNGDVALLAQCDTVPDPEDTVIAGTGLEFIDHITNFQRFLSPPPQTPKSGMTGETIFNTIGCADCHRPSYTTSNDPAVEAALRNKTIRPYSDYLLHDMGSAADFIEQGAGGTQELRTPALWGVRFRDPLWHDGRVTGPTLNARITGPGGVIEQHNAFANSAAPAAQAFLALTAADQQHVLNFLDSLGKREFDGDGDGDVDYLDLQAFLAAQTPSGPGTYTPDDPEAVFDIDADGDVDNADFNFLVQAYEEDCNANGQNDLHDILVAGTSTDVNGNYIPDECEFCQPDLGAQFGSPTMMICGDDLAQAGSTAACIIDNASPNAVISVVISTTNNPLTILPGAVVIPGLPWGSIVTVTADANGRFVQQLFGGDISVATFFVQAGYPLGAGAELTNALQVTIGQ